MGLRSWQYPLSSRLDHKDEWQRSTPSTYLWDAKKCSFLHLSCDYLSLHRVGGQEALSSQGSGADSEPLHPDLMLIHMNRTSSSFLTEKSLEWTTARMYTYYPCLPGPAGPPECVCGCTTQGCSPTSRKHVGTLTALQLGQTHMSHSKVTRGLVECFSSK